MDEKAASDEGAAVGLPAVSPRRQKRRDCNRARKTANPEAFRQDHARSEKERRQRRRQEKASAAAAAASSTATMLAVPLPSWAHTSVLVPSTHFAFAIPLLPAAPQRTPWTGDAQAAPALAAPVPDGPATLRDLSDDVEQRWRLEAMIRSLQLTRGAALAMLDAGHSLEGFFIRTFKGLKVAQVCAPTPIHRHTARPRDPSQPSKRDISHIHAGWSKERERAM